ncbi:MAG: ABC transporter permease, partial [Burkholderiales bacterium]|nr:ABC transporter permease [Burkholderiales bacterium]
MTTIQNNSTVSPGLWALAWRRLRADKVAMIAMAIVGIFLVIIALSSSGLIAADWEKEVGVSYAPPGFVGADDTEVAAKPVTAAAVPENPLDPLAGVIRELRRQSAQTPDIVTNDYGIPDPLAKEMAEIQAELAKSGKAVVVERQATLPFGADKWGHDIIKKTIKGAETSILVGLIAAFLATLLGTLFGAVAGYFGNRVDDFFNWFYSIFTSIPYLLLILSVAAVLQQKGVSTIIL